MTSHRMLVAGLACLMLAGCASTGLPELEPVDFESGSNRIRLEPVGRYSMGFFDIGAAAPAAYDPVTQRLFVVSVDRGWIDTLDISDPSEPKLRQRKVVLGYGGFPHSIAVQNGTLAVALRSVVRVLPGKVLLFDVDGRRLAAPVPVGVKPVQLAYTPGGRGLVVVNQGEANDAYTIDPEGSVTLIDLRIDDPGCRGTDCRIAPQATQLGFRAFNGQEAELRAAGVRIYGPGASVAQDLEPESVAIAPDGTTAWVALQRNNALAVVDLPGRRIAGIFGLGAKDHGLPGNGLDASDVDGRINIRPWPVFAFHQPDGMAAYEPQGEPLIVTANEGDPRDFGGFSEDVRVRELELDPAAFPDAASLQEDRNLGRLRVTDVDGDLDGDGDFDRIFALGGRSFAIWRGDGALMFDSGDQLEQTIARALPACFNCSGGSIRFDAQSADRGPEPEALAVGQVEGRHYAFIAPERIGGLYVYDITDPAAPAFQQYINLRDFTIDPGEVCEEGEPLSEACAAAGDLEPEGVLFIAAADSPIGQPMVVLTHELSTSATLYRIDEVN